MKKIVLLLSCVLMCICVDAKILQDKKESNGDRITMTYSETVATRSLYRKQGCLKRVESDGDIKWYLKLEQQDSEPFSIEQGRLLLIKLKNGDVIELKNRYTLDKADCEVRVIQHQYAVETVYEQYPEYEITKDQMMKMFSIGTEKMRVETDVEYNDYSAGRLGNFVKDAYKEISEQCKKNNDIYYDF
jgi:hypothetical protein